MPAPCRRSTPPRPTFPATARGSRRVLEQCAGRRSSVGRSRPPATTAVARRLWDGLRAAHRVRFPLGLARVGPSDSASSAGCPRASQVLSGQALWGACVPTPPLSPPRTRRARSRRGEPAPRGSRRNAGVVKKHRRVLADIAALAPTRLVRTPRIGPSGSVAPRPRGRRAAAAAPIRTRRGDPRQEAPPEVFSSVSGSASASRRTSSKVGTGSTYLPARDPPRLVATDAAGRGRPGAPRSSGGGVAQEVEQRPRRRLLLLHPMARAVDQVAAEQGASGLLPALRRAGS